MKRVEAEGHCHADRGREASSGCALRDCCGIYIAGKSHRVNGQERGRAWLARRQNVYGSWLKFVHGFSVFSVYSRQDGLYAPYFYTTQIWYHLLVLAFSLTEP